MDDPENEQSPGTFHPVHERSGDAWFPGNESSSLLVAIQHTWEDIERLIVLRKQVADDYDGKLLLKYMAIELLSLTQMMDRLRTQVMTAEVYPTDQEPLYRGISSSEHAEAKEHWTKYSDAKNAALRDLTAVRNKLAAHRDISDWQLVMTLWDKLDTGLIEGLLKVIPPAFNHAKDLNIFEWSRRPEPGVIEVLGGPVGSSLFDKEGTDS